VMVGSFAILLLLTAVAAVAWLLLNPARREVS
jgi:hypothetical protein